MGKLVAEYTDSQQQPAGGTKYVTADHLGSTRVVTSQNQSVVARYDYLPFGEEIGAGVGSRTTAMGYSLSDSTRQKFTSKERDTESGLDYFLARYYSSAQGRFTSADSFSGSLDDPQSLNLYSYVRNNPLIFVDPTGHFMAHPFLGFKDEQDKKKPIANEMVFPASQEELDKAPSAASLGIHPVFNEEISVSGVIQLEKQSTELSGLSSAILGFVEHNITHPVKNDGDRMVEGLFNWYGEQWLYAIITGGLGNVVQTLRSAQRIERTFKAVTEWLGPESRVITNEAGDKIFLSKGGSRRFRVDFNDPSPHQSPHLHVEEKINGKWMKSGPIYPKDVPPQ